MKVAVTGSTGFIGNYVVQELLKQKIEVIATSTNIVKAKQFKWFNHVEFIDFDLNINADNALNIIASADKLIHLAWSGLPNYKSLFHFENNLLPQYFFIKKLVSLGLNDITITGTCFEYGIKNGGLSANLQTDPKNSYALAKDTLRNFLLQLQNESDFSLKWLRLFYMYGKGQSDKSLLSQLDTAINNGDLVFNMSGGEQLRDYLPIEEVAKTIVETCIQDNSNALLNCCSGNPISIRKLV
jgi:nucleoside-diphosphate-sugar epimerase